MSRHCAARREQLRHASASRTDIGSPDLLKLAAEKRLRAAQPSLSRRIRDLEAELGFAPMTRSVRGIQLTKAGRILLDHARVALAQVEAGSLAARLAAQPPRPVFSLGFLVGHERDCLPLATAILQKSVPSIELRIFSNFSTTLATDLLRGALDGAFLPRSHGLASRKAIDGGLVTDYLKRAGVEIVPRSEIDNSPMAISLVEAAKGISILPASSDLTAQIRNRTKR